jgi:hypothetical protein
VITELLEAVVGGHESRTRDLVEDQRVPGAFSVDWREEDDQIVADCAEALGLPELSAAWAPDEDLVVRFRRREVSAGLRMDPGDRHRTLLALDEVLEGYQVRLVVSSLGNDTLDFLVLEEPGWRELEAAASEFVAANFLPLGGLPDVFRELTPEALPAPARARYERALDEA